MKKQGQSWRTQIARNYHCENILTQDIKKVLEVISYMSLFLLFDNFIAV